jgi:hypothetical protein
MLFNNLRWEVGSPIYSSRRAALLSRGMRAIPRVLVTGAEVILAERE